MSTHIKSTIESVRKAYNLNQYKANHAIVQAPFGQRHFDEGIKRLTDSKAVTELAKQETVLVLTITSKETKIGNLPNWIQCIQVYKVPDWSEHPVFQNRFFKWAIPFLFPNIKTSIYLDSDLIISNKAEKLRGLFELIEEHTYLSTRHVIREGWKAEYEAILNWKCLDYKKLKEQHDFFIKEGLPEEGIVFENNFIGRMHNSQLNKLNEEVLNQLNNFSERDQLGFAYACFKHKVEPFALEEGKLLYAGFSEWINYETVSFVEPWAISKLKCDSSKL
jgi:hypothetical protein